MNDDKITIGMVDEGLQSTYKIKLCSYKQPANTIDLSINMKKKIQIYTIEVQYLEKAVILLVLCSIYCVERECILVRIIKGIIK